MENYGEIFREMQSFHKTFRSFARAVGKIRFIYTWAIKRVRGGGFPTLEKFSIILSKKLNGKIAKFKKVSKIQRRFLANLFKKRK